MIPAILMINLMAVFLFICSLVRSSLFRVCLTRTPITKTKMTTLKIRMAKMGPRKAPKNTAGSSMKQLEEKCEHKSFNSYVTEYTMHSVTYNPWLCGVGLRTTRSLLTASVRSKSIGISTGMIGTTDERDAWNTNFVKHQHIFKPFTLFWLNYQPFFYLIALIAALICQLLM